MSARWPVRRRLTLPPGWGRGLGDELADQITARVAGCVATYDPSRHVVVLVCDRARCRVADIERVARGYEAWPPASWWDRIQFACAQFVERWSHAGSAGRRGATL